MLNMKKAALLLAFLPYAVYGAFDTSLFKTVYVIESQNVQQPIIAEIQNVTTSSGYAIVDNEGTIIPSQVKREKTSIAPLSVTACTTTCTPAPALSDNTTGTTFDFPLSTTGTHVGKISIVYTEPVTTNSIVFATTNDSYIPNAFSLVIDGKHILNSISGNRAFFPMMTAKRIDIEFTYEQPIRFTEVGVGANFEEVNTIRFVYEPGKTYQLFTAASGYGTAVPRPSIDLFNQTRVRAVMLGTGMNNSAYKEPDTDKDTIVDSKDNCPYVANKEQIDSDANGAGDACEDYDFDGVATYQDNCPKIANADQKDTDQDSKGDVCDGEESRLTEKFPWLPWMAVILVLLTIVYMGYDLVKNKKSTE